MQRRLCISILLCVALHVSALSAGAQQPAYQQTPLMLNTADFVPAALLKGFGYSVAGPAKNDGLVNEYSVTGSGGAAAIESTQALMLFIKEQEALEKIEKISRTDEFKSAFKKAGLGPYNTAKGLVTEPVKTAKKIGTGIGRWFSDVGYSITSGDPNQPGVAKTALGQAAAKRSFAYRLDVNPYTSNKVLQAELDELAWVSFAGGLTIKAAFAAIPDVPGLAVSLSSTSDSMKQKVRDKSPAELYDSNKKALQNMGVTPQLADELLNNYVFDPYEKTLIVGALESMPGVQNRSVFIWNTIGITDPSVALFVRLQAEYMAAYAARHTDMVAMVDVCGKTFFQSSGNTIAGIFPLDYIAWTQKLDEKERMISSAIESMKGVKGKKLIVYGKIDPLARQVLEQRGWSIMEEKPAGAL